MLPSAGHPSRSSMSSFLCDPFWPSVHCSTRLSRVVAESTRLAYFYYNLDIRLCTLLIMRFLQYMGRILE